MPRRPARSVPLVLVPGDGSSGDWRGWLADTVAGEREVRHPDLGEPDADGWTVALTAAIGDLPDNGFDLVAFRLGAALWLRHVATDPTTPRPARVALVAPPSPALLPAGFATDLDVDAVRHGAEGTVLVGTEADPDLPEGVVEAYGRPLKMATTVVDGPLDAPEWPAMLSWCRRDNLAFF